MCVCVSQKVKWIALLVCPQKPAGSSLFPFYHSLHDLWGPLPHPNIECKGQEDRLWVIAWRRHRQQGGAYFKAKVTVA